MYLNPATCKIVIGNEVLERIGNDCTCKYFKFVGIKLDEFLDWDYQIENISNKIASAVFALNQIKNILPLNIRKIVYNSLVRSHIEYGIMTWGSAKKSKLQKIIKIQKKAVRAVNNDTFRAHTDPIFSSLEILKFKDTYTISILDFMHKYYHSKLPNSFNNMFTSLAEPNRTKSYKLELVKHKSLENFPAAIFPKVWNAIELNIKDIYSPKAFKNEIKMFYLNMYKDFSCNKHNCLACQ